MTYYYSPFRKEYQKLNSSKCPFCDNETIQLQSIKDNSGKILENKYYFWMVNWYPRFEGHTMIVPKRHLLKLEDEKPEGILARNELILKAADILMKLFKTKGCEIFLQTGKKSESTVEHLHWHVLPASPDDVFRGFDKTGNFTSKEPNQEKIILFPVKIKLARGDLQKAILEFL